MSSSITLGSWSYTLPLMAVCDCRKCPINKYDIRMLFNVNYNKKQGLLKVERQWCSNE